MKLKNLLGYVSLVALIVIISCRKEFSHDQAKKLDPFVEEAKVAYYDAVSKLPQGLNESLKQNKKAKLFPIWSRAYVSKTSLHKFTEVPIIAEFKQITLYGFGKQSNEADMKSVAAASFQRLLTFKRKNAFEQYLLTYIPDLAYLKDNRMDASANYINKMSAYSGYVEYRKLNGERLFVLRFENGKATSRSRFGESITTHNSTPGAKEKAMTGGVTCSEVCQAVYFTACGPVGDPPEEHCSEPQFSHWECRQECIEDPELEEPGGPDCLDPANLYLPECGGEYEGPIEGEEEPESQDDPCDQVDSLKANSNFTSRAAALRANTSLNYETAYTMNFALNDYKFFQGSPGASSVSTSVTTPIDFWGHSHDIYSDPMFSSADVLLVGILDSLGKINDLSTFSLFVTTNQGTEYILKISDVNAFRAFRNSTLANVTSYNTWQNNYYTDQAAYQTGGMSQIASFEKAFLQAISGKGMELFKANANHTDYEPIELNSSGTPTITGCP